SSPGAPETGPAPGQAHGFVPNPEQEGTGSATTPARSCPGAPAGTPPEQDPGYQPALNARSGPRPCAGAGQDVLCRQPAGPPRLLPPGRAAPPASRAGRPSRLDAIRGAPIADFALRVGDEFAVAGWRGSGGCDASSAGEPGGQIAGSSPVIASTRRTGLLGCRTTRSLPRVRACF